MKIITKYAKQHRKNPTLAEKVLKAKLLRWNIEFRSQRQFDIYIVDFLIPKRRLVIEVDGGYHLDNQAYDSKREAYLKTLGLEILRISNEDVLNTDCADLQRLILTFPEQDIRSLPLRLSYGQANY